MGVCHQLPPSQTGFFKRVRGSGGGGVGGGLSRGPEADGRRRGRAGGLESCHRVRLVTGRPHQSHMQGQIWCWAQ